MRTVRYFRMEEEKESEIMGRNQKLGISKTSSSDRPRIEKWHFLSRSGAHRADMLQRETVVCLLCICRGTDFENIYYNQK